MPPSTAPQRLPVHPHQLEVQEFDAYDLVVDLRAAPDFEADHLPGSVSMPWGLLASALHTGSDLSGPSTVLLTEDAVAALPYGLEDRLARLEPGAPVLLVCGRGGADSATLAGRLRARGFDAQHLPGGYANYRRWVSQSLQILALALDWRWLRGPPCGAAEAVLRVLTSRGVQVFATSDCLGLSHGPGLLLPGKSGGTQAWLESRLVDGLRRLDPSRPVWTDEVLLLGAAPQLPPCLSERLRTAMALQLRLGTGRRSALLVAHLTRCGLDVQGLVSHLRAMSADAPAALSLPDIDPQDPAAWCLAVIDQLYRDRAPSSRSKAPAAELVLQDLQEAKLWAALSALPAPWPEALAPDPDQISP